MVLEDIAKRLGCTYHNASWLLQQGILHGQKENGIWTATEKDVEEFLFRHKKGLPRKHYIKAGDQFGYWTVIDANCCVYYKDRSVRAALCRCICGKAQIVNITALVNGKSKSCGCRRHLGMTEAQKDGLQKGQKLMKAIHKEKVVAGLHHSLNKNSTTGHKGVSFMPKYGTYRAYITIHRNQIHLGCFASLEDAIEARKAAEEKYLTPYREKIEEIKKGNL